jgi:hypothetical protein
MRRRRSIARRMGRIGNHATSGDPFARTRAAAWREEITRGSFGRSSLGARPVATVEKLPAWRVDAGVERIISPRSVFWRTIIEF